MVLPFSLMLTWNLYIVSVARWVKNTAIFTIIHRARAMVLSFCLMLMWNFYIVSVARWVKNTAIFTIIHTALAMVLPFSLMLIWNLYIVSIVVWQYINVHCPGTKCSISTVKNVLVCRGNLQYSN
jgi:hypothetical protein